MSSGWFSDLAVTERLPDARLVMDKLERFEQPENKRKANKDQKTSPSNSKK